MLPNFIVIGAAKAGTTTIFDLLGAHPDVFTSDPKEPHYFSRLVTFDERRPWYESLFAGADGYRAVGEASTSYAHPHRIDFVVPRIREHIPECRLIYMVRHPVRRLESDWRMRRLEGRISGAIGEAVDRNASLVTLGLYWKHLSRYRRQFPDEQILVVFLEDLAREPERELERVYRHVGVDPTFVPASSGRPRNTATDRARSAAVADLARRVPAAGRIAELLPDKLVATAKRLLARPEKYTAEANWSAMQLRAVCDLFREDSRALLRHCGKPSDFWDLEGGT